MTNSTIALLLLASLGMRNQPPHAQPTEDGEILARLIKRAKEQGQTRLNLDPPIVMETGVESIHELSSDYNWLRFHVLESWVSVRQNHLGTWYKIRIEEPIKWRGFTSPSQLPAEKLPPRLTIDPNNEGLIFQHGGDLVIDGIAIRQPLSNAGFRLHANKSYLGSFHNDAGSLLLTSAAGIDSLFEVKDGQIAPLGPANHPIAKEMRVIYSNDYRAFLSGVAKYK